MVSHRTRPDLDIGAPSGLGGRPRGLLGSDLQAVRGQWRRQGQPLALLSAAPQSCDDGTEIPVTLRSEPSREMFRTDAGTLQGLWEQVKHILSEITEASMDNEKKARVYYHFEDGLRTISQQSSRTATERVTCRSN